MAYIVLELQTYADGTTGNIIWSYDSILQAESRYHAVLSAAAISQVPIHAAVILDERGEKLANASYDHPVSE